MRKLCLLLSLCLSFLGQPAAFAQASPFNLNIFKTQSFTATGQTGAVIQLNGLTPGVSTVGSSYASGTITVGGTAITTVSFQVMGSSDNGATFYVLPVYSVTNPSATPVTTVTATAAGQYQFNLAGMSHVKFVTTGTFTATSVTLILTGSPNASISRNGSGGAIMALSSPDTTITLGGTINNTTMDINLAQANTWTNGMTIQNGLTADQIAISADGVGFTFLQGSQIYEDPTAGLFILDDNNGGINSDGGVLNLLANGVTMTSNDTDGTNAFNMLQLAGGGVPPAGFEAFSNRSAAFFVANNEIGNMDSSNTYEAQIGAAAVTSGGNVIGAFVPKFGLGDVTTTITNTNIKLVGNVTINGAVPGAGASATLENVYSAAGSFTFAHNLNSLFPVVTCFSRISSSTYAPASWTATPIDVNDMSVTVPSAGDYICSFSPGGTLAPPTGSFSVATSPTSQTYEPTMTGTQSPTFTVNQTGTGGYSGTATYSTSGLASGMTGVFSPTTITGTGSNTLTVNFPASQAAATTSFNATGNDGTNSHSANPSLTVGNINSGLVECWPMTDGSGSTFADGCGTSNTQTVTFGTLTWGSNAGLPGSTPTFNGGTSTSGANQTATNFTGATAFSVSSWVDLTTIDLNERTITSTLDTANNFIGWEFSSSSTQHLELFIVNTYPSNAIQVDSSTALTTGLHYVVATYDGSKTAAGVKIYIDGALSTSTISEDTLTGSAANSKPAFFGARTDGSDQWIGVIAYTRIYNRVLSQTDITNYFTAGAR